MARAFRWTSADLAAVQARGYQLELAGASLQTQAAQAPSAGCSAPSAALRGGALSSDLAHRGEDWEERLRLIHELYRQRGQARIEKLPTPIRRLRGGPGGKGSTFLACYESPAGADFLGVVGGGRGVVLEAKRTDAKVSWPLGKVEPQQARHLLDVSALGGLAGVLLYWQQHDAATWLPARPAPGSLEAQALPMDWCERCASEKRSLPEQLRKRLQRDLTDVERATLGVPEIPVVRFDRLRAAGLVVPWILGRGKKGVVQIPDWLPVALRCVGGGGTT
jgi:penicillin-binding protein-related factor A (putative recombinase)